MRKTGQRVIVNVGVPCIGLVVKQKVDHGFQMIDKFQRLAELGADNFEHMDGSLIAHLKGTKTLLESWGASSSLQDAGLYHAVYGTAGFNQKLLSINHREKISTIIGDSCGVPGTVTLTRLCGVPEFRGQ